MIAFVLLGMAFSASIGGIGTLVGSAPNAIFGISNSSDFHGMARLWFPSDGIACTFNVFFLYG